MIVVFGSINIDQVYQMQSLPAPGETILGDQYMQVPGGKGANQALAARRAGADVTMIGAVGDDVNAGAAVSLMLEDGVELSALKRTIRPTGCASIWVDQNAENSIVVVSGANNDATADQVSDDVLESAAYLLLQMEVPSSENWTLISRAKKFGVKSILNLAPAGLIPESVLHDLDYLVVNEGEAAAIARQHGLDTLSSDELVVELASRYDLCVILTLGASGVVAAEEGWLTRVPAMKITPVDTTAAGDCFIGVFAAALSDGKNLHDALQAATAGAGLTCSVAGAQSSLPNKDKIEKALKEL
ncbi:ribokinase [Sneathiella sp.]|uniref:ribokinase n=1 Tax=Sneathiella sp. TaxID=1964365 RepID=UPI0039E3EB2C